MRTCSVAECDRPHRARGLCHGHYVRQRRGFTRAGPIQPARWLTPEEAAEIREVYSTGDVSQTELSRWYGVARTTVQMVLSGERHVDPVHPRIQGGTTCCRCEHRAHARGRCSTHYAAIMRDLLAIRARAP